VILKLVSLRQEQSDVTVYKGSELRRHEFTSRTELSEPEFAAWLREVADQMEYDYQESRY